MKDKIINILVSVIMVIISLYPMYNTLKSTVKEVNDVIAETNLSIRLVKEEIVGWQNDLNDLSSQIDLVKYELQSTIDNGLANTEHIINKELESLNDKITNLKSNAAEEVKSRKLDFLPYIKFKNTTLSSISTSSGTN